MSTKPEQNLDERKEEKNLVVVNVVYRVGSRGEKELKIQKLKIKYEQPSHLNR